MFWKTLPIFAVAMALVFGGAPVTTHADRLNEKTIICTGTLSQNKNGQYVLVADAEVEHGLCASARIPELLLKQTHCQLNYPCHIEGRVVGNDAVANSYEWFEITPAPVITEGIIPLETDKGVSYVHIGVNGSKPLTCLLDSGAFALMLSRKQMTYLWDNHFVTKAEITGESKGYGSDGKSFKIIEMNLKRVDIGGTKSTNWTAHGENVKAAVSPDSDGSCLVGQSFLQRLKSWRVDNDKHELHLEFFTPWQY